MVARPPYTSALTLNKYLHGFLYGAKGFPCGSAGKESASNAGDLGSIPGLGRSPGEGKGYPLQYSDMENSTDFDFSVHGGRKDGVTFTSLTGLPWWL